MTRHNESNMQIACVKWFRCQYQDEIIFSIPNGGARNILTAKFLKAEGVLAGAADLQVLAARGNWNGLFIELKTTSGKQSDSQKNFENACTRNNYLYAICRSFEEFEKTVTDYLSLK
ncbi:MAG: VRR-NUC domain-containing protein [Bacteroidales bacterium]